MLHLLVGKIASFGSYYGFILGEDDTRYYFNKNDIHYQYRDIDIEVEMMVLFSPSTNPKGFCAKQVQVAWEGVCLYCGHKLWLPRHLGKSAGTCAECQKLSKDERTSLRFDRITREELRERLLDLGASAQEAAFFLDIYRESAVAEWVFLQRKRRVKAYVEGSGLPSTEKSAQVLPVGKDPDGNLWYAYSKEHARLLRREGPMAPDVLEELQEALDDVDALEFWEDWSTEMSQALAIRGKKVRHCSSCNIDFVRLQEDGKCPCWG